MCFQPIRLLLPAAAVHRNAVDGAKCFRASSDALNWRAQPEHRARGGENTKADRQNQCALHRTPRSLGKVAYAARAALREGGKMHSRNVVCLRRRTTRQQRRYVAAPNSRTIVRVCRKTSLVVISPRIIGPHGRLCCLVETDVRSPRLIPAGIKARRAPRGAPCASFSASLRSPAGSGERCRQTSPTVRNGASPGAGSGAVRGGSRWRGRAVAGA